MSNSPAARALTSPAARALDGIVLASASPRRAELLRSIGFPFTVHASNVPESPLPNESGTAFARRAAREKALAVAAERRGEWILAADTIVLIDGEILGKPVDAGVARGMLELLSGREHRVVTAFVLVRPDGTVAEDVAVETVVEFRRLTGAEIDAYIDTGEPRDKAGAYAIQGGAAGFVSRVGGSYTNVIGLPMDELRAAFERHGLVARSDDRGALLDRER